MFRFTIFRAPSCVPATSLESETAGAEITVDDIGVLFQDDRIKMLSELMTFMALLVIPKLKRSDLGLFDGEAFQFVSVEVDPQCTDKRMAGGRSGC